MRVEIVANNRASFVKPMADGLARIVRDCGAAARVHYDGIEQLMRLQSVDYSSLEMLAIFRHSAVLMLAHSEPFGFPICEAQACGCLIFTPDLNWTTAQWLGKD